MPVMDSLKQRAERLKTEVYSLLASRHPGTPWYAKAFMFLIVGYALSPVDLIPDFIPIIGYLDELVILPAGVSLALKMIPEHILEECRHKARLEPMASRAKWVGAFFVIALWLLVIFLIARLFW